MNLVFAALDVEWMQRIDAVIAVRLTREILCGLNGMR